MTSQINSSVYFSIVLILISSLMACSPSLIKNDAIEIEALILHNQSTRPLRDVRIYISKTRELVECGYILPKRECYLGFPLREYQGNYFDVSWVDNGQSRSVKNILIDVPEDLMMSKPVNAVILFDEQGRFSARLQH